MQPDQNLEDMQNAQGVEGVSVGQTAEPVSDVEGADITQIYAESSASQDYADDIVSQSQLEKDMMQGQRNDDLSQNQQATGMAQGQPKNKTKMMLIGMIAAIVIAVVGIGFGVWAMMNRNSEKEQYESKISDLTKQNSKLKKELEDNDVVVFEDEVDEEVEVEPEPESSENTADYIYVGEWGLKIKIPDGLHFVSYEFKQNGGAGQVESSAVTVSGTTGSSLSDFANLYKNNSPLGALTRVRKGAFEGIMPDGLEECGYASLVFSDSDFNYCFSGPQAVFSTDESEQDLEVESTGLIRQMLQNKDSYSSF